MKRNLAFNLTFIAIFILFLSLSLIIDFFFFIPIICFLPFSFRTIRHDKKYYEERESELLSNQISENSFPRYCSRCGGEITEPIARFCYHCGEKLNNK
jgi:hypothetical protein